MNQENKQLPTADWTVPDGKGNIDVPDHLMPLFNYVWNQLRFHRLSGKNEILTIAHIVRKFEEYTAPLREELEKLRAENERLKKDVDDLKRVINTKSEHVKTMVRNMLHWEKEKTELNERIDELKEALEYLIENNMCSIKGDEIAKEALKGGLDE